MSVGIEFMGTSESEKISESYSNTIMRDTKTSYSLDYSLDIELTCTGTDGVGLWQWVSETNDSKSKVLSQHTVCRYGENAFV